jgi:hypothetical protein
LRCFAALEAARSFAIDGEILIIKDDSGKVILKLKKYRPSQRLRCVARFYAFAVSPVSIYTRTN